MRHSAHNRTISIKKIGKKEKKYWTSGSKSCILNSGRFGEVPKLAEGAPLERE